jgi:hypothetical protein
MKGFFRNFTGAIYNFDTKDYKSERVITDITRSIQFKDIGNFVRYDKYYITDGETPDSLAYKLYGDPTKHWILYLLNPDLKKGWPYSDAELERLITSKYGAYSFLSLANEDVYAYKTNKNDPNETPRSIDFSIADSVKIYLDPDDEALDVTFHQFDYTRRTLIISQKPNDTEWMKDLDTIFIKFFNGEGSDRVQVGSTIELSVNPDNCHYLMKNAAYSYDFKSYRDALLNGDSIQYATSFEQYEYDKNESKKFIRVLNSSDAERVSQQYFQILEDG